MKRTINDILAERAEIFKHLGISADCKWFGAKSLKSIDDLVEVFYHPQGVEFCQTHNFPSIEVLRRFKTLNVEQYGVYIDAGNITINNPQKCILIGNTNATIECTEGGSDVIMMHNALATVKASGWAVVMVHLNNSCIVTINKSDRAIVNASETEVQ